VQRAESHHLNPLINCAVSNLVAAQGAGVPVANLCPAVDAAANELNRSSAGLVRPRASHDR